MSKAEWQRGRSYQELQVKIDNDCGCTFAALQEWVPDPCICSGEYDKVHIRSLKAGLAGCS